LIHSISKINKNKEERCNNYENIEVLGSKQRFYDAIGTGVLHGGKLF
jgi:hypothetical protein